MATPQPISMADITNGSQHVSRKPWAIGWHTVETSLLHCLQENNRIRNACIYGREGRSDRMMLN